MEVWGQTWRKGRQVPHFVSEWSELGMGREWIKRKTQKALVYKGMKREWLVRLLDQRRRFRQSHNLKFKPKGNIWTD